MCPDMLCEQLGGIGYRSSKPRRVAGGDPRSSRDEFSDQFISFAALRFQSSAGGVASALPMTLPALPPFYKVIPGASVPYITVSGSVERNKFPDATGQTDFLDNPYPFAGGPDCGSSAVRDGPGRQLGLQHRKAHGQILGVYFCDFIDTKRLPNAVRYCK